MNFSYSSFLPHPDQRMLVPQWLAHSLVALTETASLCGSCLDAAPGTWAVMVEDRTYEESLMTDLVEDHSPALLARSTKQTDSIVAFAVLI